MASEPGGPDLEFGLVAQARRDPTAVALIDDGREVTYGELDARARRIAELLQGRGVRASDRVALMAGNGADWFAACHGIGRYGAIVVPVNIHFKGAEVAHVLRDCGAAAVLTEAAHLDRIAEAGMSDDSVLSLDDDFAALDAAEIRRCDGGEVLGGPAADGWPTVMTYTSGTTGNPKGVAIGDDDFRRRASGFATMASPWNIGRDDVHLLVGPAYHAGPAAWAQVHLAVGGTVVVMAAWDAEECLRLIDFHGVTTTHMVPANFIRLLDLPEEVRGRYDVSTMRLAWHAAAPCPVPVKWKMMDWFPPDSIWEYYGASEGGGTSISPQEWRDRPGSVGRPYPGNEFKVTDDDGVALPPGETGVIWVRTQFSEFKYHDDPEKTAQTYDTDGFFSVGDMGHLDDDGYLFITDRRADMVISGGVNIYPREIENCLYEHPQVLDCAVVGVPDDDWGESLLAVVQPVAGTSPSADVIVSWCRDHLADYKAPRHVELVEELPREPNGKVRKVALRHEWVAALGEV